MSGLLEKLKDYSASGALPMHMPGHKRNICAFPWLAELGCGIDITEIDGFDNLNEPEGLFRGLERRAARLWGAEESVCLVNGSTVGVLAGVRAALERGGELLLARGAHRSVYHAAELARVRTHYLTPAWESGFGICASVTPEDVAAALDSHPKVRLVVITSPTYEGVISDVSGIARVCHERSVPLFVDSAHGAHLGFGRFPTGAARCGADMVVQSLHKTLPSLTQTAILHMNGERIDRADVRRNVVMLQSSSPSYILSASIDGCVDYLEREGEAAAGRWMSALDDFRCRVSGLEKLRVLSGGEHIFDLDPSKIVISTAGTDMEGAELMDALRRGFGIELEMASRYYAVAMTGMGDTEGTLARFASALLKLDGLCGKGGGEAKFEPFTLPEKRLEPWEAVAASGKFFGLEDAVGRISGEYVWAYPPDVPVIAAGEVVDDAAVRAIRSANALHSTRGGAPERIFCVGNIDRQTKI